MSVRGKGWLRRVRNRGFYWAVARSPARAHVTVTEKAEPIETTQLTTKLVTTY
jgi:hypothetical protein